MNAIFFKNYRYKYSLIIKYDILSLIYYGDKPRKS